MLHRDDKNLVELPSQICLGCITNEDIKLLSEQNMELSGNTISESMKEVAQKLSELSTSQHDMSAANLKHV